jgi:hypothetical protein
MSTMHEQLFPAFYSDVQPVELPELSWQDVENLAAKDDDAEQVSETQQPEPEPEPIDPAKEAAEREQRIKNAERCFDRTTYDNQLRSWARQDRAMDEELASGNVRYLDRHRIAFHKVIGQRNSLVHRSTVKVQQFEDKGSAKRKASAPNRIDCIVDTESVAKRALKDEPKLLRTFLHHLQGDFEFWEGVPADIRVQIEHRVGWWFIRAGLHPANRYWS